MGDDKDTAACEEAGLTWTNAVQALQKAYKAYIAAETAGDPEALDAAGKEAAAKRDAFNAARKAVKEKCDGPRTHGWPLGNGITVRIDPDVTLTINHYKALLILLKLGKKATGGATIILKPTKAPRPPKHDPNKELGGTYVGKAVDDDDEDDVITIFDWNNKGDLFAVPQLKLLLKHEMGHRVMRLLDDPQKKDKSGKTGKQLWDDFWNDSTGDKPNKTPVSKGGKMPNDYAGTTTGEGFAVCFELFYDDEPLDPVTKAKLEEILKLL